MRHLLPWTARLLFLGCLLATCHYTWKRVSATPDLALGCDQWGHLHNLEALRVARRLHAPPRYDLTSPQSELLLAFLKAQPDPVAHWQFVPAPHAFTYRPDTDKVINQYPPGAAYVLAAAGAV